MSNYEQAPLLKEAFAGFVAERDPILAAPRRSNWSIIEEQAAYIRNNIENLTYWGAMVHALRLANRHCWRNLKTAIQKINFVALFKTGERKAVGHVAPRHENSRFTPIDRAFWHEAKVDIEGSSLTAEDTTFRGVRVPDQPMPPAEGLAPRSQGPEAGGTAAAAPQSKGAAGRPTVRPHVWRACDQLWETPGFQTAPRKDQANRVRAVIRIDDPQDKVIYAKLRDRGLRDHITEYIKQRSSAPKP